MFDSRESRPLKKKPLLLKDSAANEEAEPEEMIKLDVVGVGNKIMIEWTGTLYKAERWALQTRTESSVWRTIYAGAREHSHTYRPRTADTHFFRMCATGGNIPKGYPMVLSATYGIEISKVPIGITFMLFVFVFMDFLMFFFWLLFGLICVAFCVCVAIFFTLIFENINILIFCFCFLIFWFFF